MFQPAEIVHAAFPFTDFILAFITTSSAPASSAHSVAVDPSHPEWRGTGLKRPPLVRADKLTTLHLSVIRGAIGILPEDLMSLVRDRIRQLLCPIETPKGGSRR